MDTYEVPFYVVVPESSGSFEYKWIASDSVYFSKGSLLLGGTVNPSNPVGARLRLEGDKLYFSSAATQNQQRTQSGIVINSVASVKFVATYQKQ